MTEHDVPEILIEKLALGELDEAEAARVRAVLGDDAEARIAALRRDDEAILGRHRPAAVAAEVQRRLRRDAPSTAGARPRMSWWMPVGVAAAAAAALVVVLRPGDDPDPGHGTDGTGDPSVVVGDDDVGPESVYIKGDARMWIDRVDDGGSTRLDDQAPVRAGDRLQVHYLAADRPEGVIVSIDGDRVATLHFPASLHDDPALRTGGPVALDHSYELDDAPGFERFFFVTAPKGTPLDVGAVMDAAHALAEGDDPERGRLALPEALEQRSITLRKQ